MNPETAKDTKSPAPRGIYSRTRWFGGVVVLLLVMWGTKAIHYALQPKYQGKTMEEWFRGSYPYAVKVGAAAPYEHLSNHPAAEAMRHFGTNAVGYLWREYHRQEPDLVEEGREFWNERVLHRLSFFDNSAARRARAQALLSTVRTNANLLIPELVAEVDGRDPAKSAEAAVWMSILRIQPEECVPALMRALADTQRIPAVNHSLYAGALVSFGKDAERALPLLIDRYEAGNLNVVFKGPFASAIVKLDSMRERPEYLERVLDTNDSTITSYALFMPARAGILSTSVLPQVKIFADKVTDPGHKRLLTRVIEMLEKQSKP